MAIKASRLLIIPLVVALALIGGCGFLGGTNGNTPPGGIGNTNGIPAATVNMTANSFSQSAVSIRQQQSVDFANTTGSASTRPTVGSGAPSGSGATPGGTTSGGGTALTVCTGQNGTCSLDKAGPTVMQWPPALVVPGGESTAVPFVQPGTYHVTIKGQPGANLTVTVTQ